MNLTEIVVQVVSFLILIILLRAFAWKHIFNILEQRRERIAAEFKAIEETKSAVARLKNEYETNLAAIEQKARERINGAREESRRITEEMQKNAQAQAQDIISDARRNIAYELKKAQDEVRDKIVDLAINAAEAVIRAKLDGEDDRKIVEEFIDNIDKAG